jgi:NTE family protein
MARHRWKRATTTSLGEARIVLALQGGGSHGAFTWGVLDRLLEEDRLEIAAASGASAGAINAVLLASGLADGGRIAARDALRHFWEQLGRMAPAGAPELGIPALRMLSHWFAPLQWNPLDLNPLRNLVGKAIDFDRLRRSSTFKLFIAATRVDTGKLRIFHSHELTCDALLASACLPWLHHTIEIEGVAYWDGGLTANPPLYSLIDHTDVDDLVIVAMHPHRRKVSPSSAAEIASRVSEISFTSAFFAEFQGVLSAQRVARRQWLPIGRMIRRLRRLRLHVIDGGDLTAQIPAASRMDVSRSFTDTLFEHGRARAQRWLDTG